MASIISNPRKSPEEGRGECAELIGTYVKLFEGEGIPEEHIATGLVSSLKALPLPFN